MKLVTIVVTTLVMACGLVADMSAQAAPAAAAQAPAGRGAAAGAKPAAPPVVLDATKPHDKNLTLDIVEVVGCLADGPNNTFVLASATEAIKGGTPSTTLDALKADETKPLGTNRYVLIGASEWNPASHKGQKLAVKGLMIKDVKETRINVTSLQKVGDTCGK